MNEKKKNIIDTEEVVVDGKARKVQTLTPVASAVAKWKEAHPGSSGGGNNSGSGSGNETPGGSGSGNSGGNATPTVTAPTISGTTPFAETTQVTITEPEGARVYYTTDGSTPTSESTLYSEPFTLSASTTVKAIAIKDGVSSSVTSRTFTKSSGGGSEDPEQE